MTVYLDNCCYNRPYDDQTQLRISLETQAKLKIQDMIKNREIKLASSYILMYENSRNPHEMRIKAIRGFVKDHVSVYIGVDWVNEIKPLADRISPLASRQRMRIMSPVLFWRKATIS